VREMGKGKEGLGFWFCDEMTGAKAEEFRSRPVVFFSDLEGFESGRRLMRGAGRGAGVACA
jgi:hypothetical protein